MLTKSDFLLYLDAPLHLWAEHNNQIEKSPSSYELQIFEQGKEIEKLGKEYLSNLLKNTVPNSEIEMEKTFIDGGYQARVDVALYDPKEHIYDIYEIKSSTSVKKEHQYDIAFQRLVMKASAAIRKAFVVHVNREYVREGNLDLDNFFMIEDVTEAVEKLESEVSTGREQARLVLTSSSPTGIIGCVKPETCPCPRLCHPHLPSHSIFDIPRLNEQKARELKARGILSITDIPEDYPLSDRQRAHSQYTKIRQTFHRFYLPSKRSCRNFNTHFTSWIMRLIVPLSHFLMGTNPISMLSFNIHYIWSLIGMERRSTLNIWRPRTKTQVSIC